MSLKYLNSINSQKIINIEILKKFGITSPIINAIEEQATWFLSPYQCDFNNIESVMVNNKEYNFYYKDNFLVTMVFGSRNKLTGISAEYNFFTGISSNNGFVDLNTNPFAESTHYDLAVNKTTEYHVEKLLPPKIEFSPFGGIRKIYMDVHVAKEFSRAWYIYNEEKYNDNVIPQTIYKQFLNGMLPIDREAFDTMKTLRKLFG